MPSQGGYGSADIGALGVVDISDARELCHLLAAMWQTPELAQGRHHRRQRQAGGITQGERGQRVGHVVATDQAQLPARQQRRQALAERFLTRLLRLPRSPAAAACQGAS